MPAPNVCIQFDAAQCITTTHALLVSISIYLSTENICKTYKNKVGQENKAYIARALRIAHINKLPVNLLRFCVYAKVTLFVQTESNVISALMSNVDD